MSLRLRRFLDQHAFDALDRGLFVGALHRGDFATRSLPHTIIVNRKGRRFVNEAQNYNDMMKAFFAFEPNAYERPNLPAWLVFDAEFRRKYPRASKKWR